MYGFSNKIELQPKKRLSNIELTESVPESDEIGSLIEEIVNLARKTNLEVDSDDVQELVEDRYHDLYILSRVT
ncbi:hypothetical protein TNCV_2515981 [Trichonephila clavipes]|nr:hypothetical protein TNCV_2515981 [Trichonephila clavipes]